MKMFGKICVLLSAVLLLTGCSAADETKSPAQIRQEAISLSEKQIICIIQDYEEVIQEKSEKLKNISARITKILMEKKNSKAASGLEEDATRLQNSIEKLTANMKAYQGVLLERHPKRK